MRTTHYITVCLLAAVSALGLSSCMDEDTEQSMVLSGQWQGDFGMYYELENRHGDWIRFDSYDTDIVFYPDYDYASHGYGYQVDYYRHGPYRELYYKFYWSVRDGVIRITYPYPYDVYNADIYDYQMTNDYFSGRFGESSSTFRLVKLVDYYDWGAYTCHGEYWYDYNTGFTEFHEFGIDYDYGGYGPYSYGMTRTAANGGSTGNDATAAPKMRIGNRYK